MSAPLAEPPVSGAQEKAVESSTQQPVSKDHSVQTVHPITAKTMADQISEDLNKSKDKFNEFAHALSADMTEANSVFMRESKISVFYSAIFKVQWKSLLNISSKTRLVIAFQRHMRT